MGCVFKFLGLRRVVDMPSNKENNEVLTECGWFFTGSPRDTCCLKYTPVSLTEIDGYAVIS